MLTTNYPNKNSSSTVELENSSSTVELENSSSMGVELEFFYH